MNLNTIGYEEIIGFKNYYINKIGNIISLKYNKSFMMTPSICKRKGYLYGRFRINGLNKKVSIHRLVAIQFIPNLGKKSQVNHINGIKTDNRVENLEWVSNRENCSHRELAKNRSSSYIGVMHNKKHNNWTAKISINKKKISLGTFNTEIEAHFAYQNSLKKFGIENKYSSIK